MKKYFYIGLVFDCLFVFAFLFIFNGNEMAELEMKVGVKGTS